jgi:large subunit ribosomal protein L24
MNKIKRNDNVLVLSGKDKGKQGQVRHVMPKEGRALVTGLNLVKRHRRPRSANETGGIIEMEAPLHLSKLMVVCPSCGKASRLGIRQKADGTRFRYCKKCESELE